MIKTSAFIGDSIYTVRKELEDFENDMKALNYNLTIKNVKLVEDIYALKDKENTLPFSYKPKILVVDYEIDYKSDTTPNCRKYNIYDNITIVDSNIFNIYVPKTSYFLETAMHKLELCNKLNVLVNKLENAYNWANRFTYKKFFINNDDSEYIDLNSIRIGEKLDGEISFDVYQVLLRKLVYKASYLSSGYFDRKLYTFSAKIIDNKSLVVRVDTLLRNPINELITSRTCGFSIDLSYNSIKKYADTYNIHNEYFIPHIKYEEEIKFLQAMELLSTKNVILDNVNIDLFDLK